VASFGVLNVPCPAVLVELLFINNPTEEAMLSHVGWQDRFGYVLAGAIRRYMEDM
jgi:N-acetylmuramoyl-L-alanine amidase